MEDLKTVNYSNWGLPKIGIAAYVFFGKRCYFTGSERSAQNIIKAIVKKEQCGPYSTDFFEVQTHLGYSKKPSGSFEVKRIILKKPGWIRSFLFRMPQEDVEIERTESSEFPSEVGEFFRNFIGDLDSAFNAQTPEEAKNAGYTPTDLHTNMIQDLHSYIHHAREENPKSPVLLIIVDYGEIPEHRETNKGYRYRIWQKIKNAAIE